MRPHRYDYGESTSAPGDFVIQCGKKFKGQRVRDIDQSYLRWLVQQPWLNRKTRDAVEKYLESPTTRYERS